MIFIRKKKYYFCIIIFFNLKKATYGERLGVVTTIQLALIVLLSVIEQRVAPAGTGNQPILFGFFVYSTIVCLFSFSETIFYLYWSDGNGTVRIPNFLKPLYRRIMPCPVGIGTLYFKGVNYFSRKLQYVRYRSEKNALYHWRNFYRNHSDLYRRLDCCFLLEKS